MRLIGILVVLLLAGCTSDWAITDKGFAAHLSLMDLRRDYRSASALDAEVVVEKQGMSEEFADALVPIVQSAVRAALICAGLGNAATLVDGCKIPNLPQEVIE